MKFNILEPKWNPKSGPEVKYKQNITKNAITSLPLYKLNWQKKTKDSVELSEFDETDQ